MLLEPEFLSRLEYLSLISRRVFRGQLLAQSGPGNWVAGLNSPTIASIRPATI